MVKSLKIGKSAAKRLDKSIKIRYNLVIEKNKGEIQVETRRLHEFLPEIKDYYTINTDGQVFSDNSGLMKTRNRAGTNYQIINFQMVNNKKKTFRLHRLVLMAFQPVKNMDSLEVNHIDGDKTNNKLENLEWCTPSENQQHAFNTGLQKARRGSKSNFSKLSKEDIKKIFILREQGYTQQKIADEIGCTRSNISYILNKKTWQV